MIRALSARHSLLRLRREDGRSPASQRCRRGGGVSRGRRLQARGRSSCEGPAADQPRAGGPPRHAPDPPDARRRRDGRWRARGRGPRASPRARARARCASRLNCGTTASARADDKASPRRSGGLGYRSAQPVRSDHLHPSRLRGQHAARASYRVGRRGPAGRGGQVPAGQVRSAARAKATPSGVGLPGHPRPEVSAPIRRSTARLPPGCAPPSTPSAACRRRDATRGRRAAG